MTPEETRLVAELFDRLAELETAPRDAEAERLITQGLQSAPHAVYALVQTALIQDEALRRANARIEELEVQLSEVQGDAQQPDQRSGSFLDNMREALGGRASRGSVPSVRAGAQDHSPPGYQSQGFQSQPPPQPGYPPPYPEAPSFGGGGSFLGNAASTAAGFIGGALLLNGIRSMFGHHLGGHEPNALGNLAGERPSPWHGGTADSDRARDAGTHHAERVSDNRDQSSEANTADDYESADADEVAEEDEFGGDDWDSPDDTYDA